MQARMSPQQAIICGWLAGALAKEGRDIFPITDIRQVLDERGNYLPAFEVSLSTGSVLRVTVETVKEPTVQEGMRDEP